MGAMLATTKSENKKKRGEVKERQRAPLNSADVLTILKRDSARRWKMA